MIDENSTLCGPEETGRLGVFRLKRFWNRTRLGRRGASVSRSNEEWVRDKVMLSGLGLPTEETMKYLLHEDPEFDEFEDYILALNGGRVEPRVVERLNATLAGREYPAEIRRELAGIEAAAPVLTPEDLAFWDANGYVIVREAISKTDAAETAAAVWEFLGAAPDDPDSWYRALDSAAIFLDLYHHETLRRNRRAPRIRKAFAELWETADLWPSIDRAGFNPPEKPGRYKYSGPYLHWDMSLAPPFHFGTQGVLYLTDTTAEQGAFTCIPGFHRRLAAWLDGLPPDADPRAVDMEAFGPRAIPAEAGDLIVWHQWLPHGSRPNRADRPRLVQYLNMFANRRDDGDEWK